MITLDKYNKSEQLRATPSLYSSLGTQYLNYYIRLHILVSAKKVLHSQLEAAHSQ